MSNKLIKVVLANDQVFPQTVVEAVLINGDQVTTLDKVLPKKIENIITPNNSGLTVSKQGTSITIAHTNKIIFYKGWSYNFSWSRLYSLGNWNNSYK